MKLFVSLLIVLISYVFESLNPTPALVPFRRGDKWGYANPHRRLVIPLQYDEAGPFVDGFAWVRQGALFGYINSSGSVVIPLQYTRASNFHRGRAAVVLVSEAFDINSSGQPLSTLPEPEPEIDFLTQGHITHQNGKLGFRFTVGSAVVPPQYDEIREMANGLLFVRQAQKWGAVNGKGKLILPIAYDAIRASSDDGFAFPILEQQGRFGYLAADGDVLVKPKYRAAEPFVEGVARVVTEAGQVGYIDARGEEYFEQ